VDGRAAESPQVTDERPPRAPRAPKPPRSIKAQAVAHLARREYSRTELRLRLLKGEVSAEAVDAALDELAAAGLLSDVRFANAVVRQKSGAYSRRAISETLKARGVTGDEAAGALAGHEIDDADAMVALWRRRFGAAPKDDRAKARQIRFLQSRGFALSAIFRLLRNPPTTEHGEGDLPQRPAR
jgi:regulatory protein